MLSTTSCLDEGAVYEIPSSVFYLGPRVAASSVVLTHCNVRMIRAGLITRKYKDEMSRLRLPEILCERPGR
jgi:hypothetical protein